MENIIEVNHCSKRYGQTWAVHDLSFRIQKGSITGFIGKNGAGKTTTIRAMMDLIRPDSGSISICGLDSRRDAKEIRQKVGYMPGDCVFYKNLKGMDILKFCTSVSGVSLPSLLELAEQFELNLNKKIGELSLGNRKKLSILQALSEDKELFILDEPTNGLDPFMQNRFFSLLLKYKSEGKTIFLSSHNLSDVERYCDRAIILKDGKIVEDIEDLSRRKERQAYMVHYITRDGEEKSYSFSGSPDDLIRQLSALSLQELEIRKASVEDEFIKYFEE